jgi:hypothetical protein
MLPVPLRTCKVSVSDVEGIEHSVEVTAETLYGAVAAALVAFHDDAWVAQIGYGLTTLTVAVQPAVIEHKVRVQDFLAWLARKGGSPAEVALRNKLSKMLA